MAQLQFDHGGAGGAADGNSSCAIYASRDWLRTEMTEDARAADLNVVHSGALDAADGGGDVVLVDCPTDDPAAIGYLQDIAANAAQAGAAVLVSATMNSLEAVYCVLPHGDVPLLVEPTRVERVIALGAILATMPAMGVRELSDKDRLALLRLTEQVGQIAERLESLAGGGPADGDPSGGGLADGDLQDGSSAFRFGDKGQDYRGEDRASNANFKRRSLPDPRLVRSIIRQRQARAKYFGEELFADPAWDMLLDLAAAHAEYERVSVTSLCIASGVPPTTALRWITQMIEAGLLERAQDSADKRRAFIRLSDRAVDGMARYFAEIAKEDGGRIASRLV